MKDVLHHYSYTEAHQVKMIISHWFCTPAPEQKSLSKVDRISKWEHGLRRKQPDRSGILGVKGELTYRCDEPLFLEVFNQGRGVLLEVHESPLCGLQIVVGPPLLLGSLQ